MKRRLPPDNRLDWRDPNMPVLRYGKFNNSDEMTTEEVKPENITKYYKAKLDQVGHKMLDYKNDPSYWWSKKNRK